MTCTGCGAGGGGVGLASATAAGLVRVLHILLVAWVVLTPFLGSDPMLVLHLVFVPFLWLHWFLNQDTCALTVLEQSLRGVSADRSFFHSLVSPVYKIRDADVRAAAWVASVLLWLVTLRKVLARPGMVRDFLTQPFADMLGGLGGHARADER